MRTITASEVGRCLSRAGFQSQRGVEWAHGFKASVFLPYKVVVAANFGSASREAEALERYADALEAAGYSVDRGSSAIFVSKRPV